MLSYRKAKTEIIMKTIIIRDTNYSFVRTITKQDGTSFSRKIEKGNVDYSNACMLFHTAKVELVVGNKLDIE